MTRCLWWCVIRPTFLQTWLDLHWKTTIQVPTTIHFYQFPKRGNKGMLPCYMLVALLHLALTLNNHLTYCKLIQLVMFQEWLVADKWAMIKALPPLIGVRTVDSQLHLEYLRATVHPQTFLEGWLEQQWTEGSMRIIWRMTRERTLVTTTAMVLSWRDNVHLMR